MTRLYEHPPRPGARNGWEIVGTRGRLTDDAVHLLEEGADGRRREQRYPIQYETQPAAGGTGETLVRAYVETTPPVVWENTDAALALPGGQDEVARARQLLGFHHAVTAGAPPEYGAQEA